MKKNDFKISMKKAVKAGNLKNKIKAILEEFCEEIFGANLDDEKLDELDYFLGTGEDNIYLKDFDKLYELMVKHATDIDQQRLNKTNEFEKLKLFWETNAQRFINVFEQHMNQGNKLHYYCIDTYEDNWSDISDKTIMNAIDVGHPEFKEISYSQFHKIMKEHSFPLEHI